MELKTTILAKRHSIQKNILVSDIVNRNAFVIQIHETIQSAALLMSESQASDLMVIDNEKNLIGVLSEGDLIRTVIPNLGELINTSKNTLAETCKIFLESAEDIAQQPIDRLIIRNPITLKQNDELFKAAIIMATKQIRCLPVVNYKKFIGTVSRADICQAILAKKRVL